jgi:ribonuclease HI
MSDNNSFPKIFPLLNYRLNFDGCSKGNPGKAGIGAVLYCGEDELWSSKQYIGNRTNNESEYLALIFGLQAAISRSIDELLVCGDSMLVINQMNGTYKVKNQQLIDLHRQAKSLCKSFKYIEFKHVYRQFNKRADKLANDSLIVDDTDDDSIYEETKEEPINIKKKQLTIKFPNIFNKAK